MAAKVLLWLFVLDLGVVFGAGLYEARITVPRWQGADSAWHPDEAVRDDVGRRFWGFTTTVPLTVLTFANLYFALQSSGPLRTFWLTASLAALGDRVFTFSYFIPRMVALMRTVDSAAARAQMTTWAQLNYLRQALILIAWLAALQAFSLFRAG